MSRSKKSRTRRRGAAEKGSKLRACAFRRETALFIFARAPVAGGVKKRLARKIGDIAAAMWYRCSLAKTLRTARGSRIPFRVSTPPETRTIAGASLQPPGNLGRKMGGVAKRCGGPCIIVGSDIPGLSATILRAAARMAHRFDLVIGPACDGGYYLIGVRSPAHVFRLYDNVRWSGESALTDTLANAPKHWRIGYLPVLSDVDFVRDLRASAQPPASALVSTISSSGPRRRAAASNGLSAVPW